MKVFVATKNSGKLAEMRAIFAGSVLELETYDRYTDVDETADDYIGNARLKARALYEQLQEAGIAAAVLADDSGLEVDALGGRPGVLSARYAGKNVSWHERRQHLLRELENVSNDQRGGAFMCTFVLIMSNGTEIDAVGTLPGMIAPKEHGDSGFGYDPIFIPKGENRTFGEFSFDEKNAVSHRRRAADNLLAKLSSKE